ncbi:MAG TPA: non-heme iron oxygenase ferredoxin subunit [Mycobacteriales bacterium]|jgi:3-phenylpropionate/trans-cinnamate dioxygenase ferredoxin subunit|nr:non-heme iron oxygenase ferredoxin subunit [Mycobacteriales bacterium]
MSFTRACALADLAEDAALAVEIDGVAICLARSQGEVLALLDECSHAEVALSDGEVTEGTIECWLHGSRFDLRTGKPIGPPATEAVATYPVRIDGDDVYVAVKE